LLDKNIQKADTFHTSVEPLLGRSSS